jgi:hypothetical protein
MAPWMPVLKETLKDSLTIQIPVPEKSGDTWAPALLCALSMLQGSPNPPTCEDPLCQNCLPRPNSILLLPLAALVPGDARIVPLPALLDLWSLISGPSPQTVPFPAACFYGLDQCFPPLPTKAWSTRRSMGDYGNFKR